MQKKNRIALAAVLVFMLVAATGCIVIKDDRGRHKGHYKQPEKTLKKAR